MGAFLAIQCKILGSVEGQRLILWRKPSKQTGSQMFNVQILHCQAYLMELVYVC